MPLRIAVVGATGSVGHALVEALAEAPLSAVPPRLFASEHGAGTTLDAFEDARVQALSPRALEGIDLAFVAATAGVARELAAPARAAGCALVDLTPADRGDPEVPLVQPELGLDALAAGFARQRRVAIPGSAAAQLAVALAPLHRAAGVERASAVVLESVSAGGRAGVDALEAELRAMLAFQEPPPPAGLPHRVAFNLVPQSGSFGEGEAADRSETERGATAEVRRLLGSSLKVDLTALRVPVFYGHVQAVSVTTRRPLPVAEARELLRAAPGVKVLDAPGEGVYPMPMLAVNDEAVLVGRLRADPTQERGLLLVSAADNVRRAAASALGVARALVERGLVTPRA